MKKVVAALLILVVVIFNATPGYCETPAFRKFRRGFCNMLTFYLEIGQQMEKEGAIGGNVRAVTVGLLRGVCFSALRAVAGAYEVVTFPLPLPTGYEPMVKDPEFYWTEPFAETKGK